MNALKLVNQQLLKDKIPTLLNSLKLLKRVIIESEYIMCVCVWERERERERATDWAAITNVMQTTKLKVNLTRLRKQIILIN